MSHPDLQQVKQALLDAGVEIYRTRDDRIEIAERVRLHIMDSGVRVHVQGVPAVEFTARSQRSDSPSAAPDDLFGRVREVVGAQASSRGYHEAHADTVQVTDPVDDSKVLDVWYEITYRKEAPDPGDVVDEVRWTLGLEKYVSP